MTKVFITQEFCSSEFCGRVFFLFVLIIVISCFCLMRFQYFAELALEVIGALENPATNS